MSIHKFEKLMYTMKQPELGKIILELRHKKGLTQAELAEKTRIGLRTVQRIENASVDPRVQTIKILFDYLEYDYNNTSNPELKENINTNSTDNVKNPSAISKKTKATIAVASVFIIIVFGFIVIGRSYFNANSASEIIGTWELVMFDHGGGLHDVKSNDEKRVKTIVEDHFMWVNFNNEEKEVNTSAGGTYALDGDMYIELISYGSSFMKNFIGTESTFIWKVEDNILTIEGKLSTGLEITEVWKRVADVK